MLFLFNNIILGYIILLLIIVFLLWMYYIKNKIYPYYHAVQNSWYKFDTEIKSLLKIIMDLLELIESTIGIKHQIMVDIEKNVQNVLISASNSSKSMEIISLISKLNKLEDIFKNYPELERKTQINDLKNNLEKTKQNLICLGSDYNEFVNNYNNLILKFPYNIPASMLVFHTYPNIEIRK
ncbi:LemA family protein [Candidatus Poribacteria bacterium]|nr:LemA family protein [Candidatus Poribacteria bacterium]